MSRIYFLVPGRSPRPFQIAERCWLQGYPAVPRTIRLIRAGISTMRNPVVRGAGYEKGRQVPTALRAAG